MSDLSAQTSFDINEALLKAAQVAKFCSLTTGCQ